MPDPASFVSITRLVDTRRSIESRKNIESAIYQISRYVHWRASSSNFPVACTNGNDEERKRFVENFSPNAKRRLSWLITCTSPPFVLSYLHESFAIPVFTTSVSLATALQRGSLRISGWQRTDWPFFIFVIRADDRSIPGSLSTQKQGRE